tara:strand:+ start:8685 stop:10334 length:1650 start_codon:yes stop_codon:yes gene_type:complete
MRILNASQIRRVEEQVIKQQAITSLELMENAGRSAFEIIKGEFGELKRAVVLCGRGSNGGDGWIVGRLFHEYGVEVEGVAFAYGDDLRGDTRAAFDRAVASGLPVTEIVNEDEWETWLQERVISNKQKGTVSRNRPNTDVVVDALVGTGLNRPLTGLFASVVRDINHSERFGSFQVVAIDIPSGFASDSICEPGPTVDATLTVTFGVPKYPCVMGPALSRIGRLVVANIGLTAQAESAPPPRVWLLDRERATDLAAIMDNGREGGVRQDAHKGSFGHAMIVAGSHGKTGAAQLAGLGALRSGAGLVMVAAPNSCLGEITHIPEYMTYGLPHALGKVSGEGSKELLALNHDVIAVGPGLGTGRGPRSLVERLIEDVTNVPLVLDADGLNVLADDIDTGPLTSRGGAPIVLTPHPREFSRLAKMSVSEIQADRVGAARDFAVQYVVFVVLKGAQTIVACPDGCVFVNTTGNPGMATGGSGDVLTGVVAGLFSRNRSMAHERIGEILQYAVYLHGYAGDLAAAEIGATGVIASDIAVYLGRAANGLNRRNRV